jgi:hypothetical protein
MSFCIIFNANVQAETSDGLVYSKPVSYVENEDESRTYTYSQYNNGGLQEGTFSMPKEMWNSSSYFVVVDSSGVVSYYRHAKKPSDSIFKVAPRTYNSDFKLFTNTFQNNKYIDRYDYDKTTSSWKAIKVNNCADYMSYGGSRFFANDIILKKASQIRLYENETSTNYVDYDIFKRYNAFEVPELFQKVDSFRLYLNDFITKDGVNNDILKEKFTITSMSLFAHELTSDNLLLDNFDVLHYKEVSQDEKGNYYVDLIIDEVMPFLKAVNSEFVFMISTTIKEDIDAKAFESNAHPDWYTMSTKFVSYDFWKYKYENGSSTLKPINPDGTDKNPTPNPDNPDNPAPDNPNQGVIDSLDKQTDAIKENTETSKNILQKIIEIPKMIIDGLLDMIKSIFIPSDDFFTNWLDDLNQYFRR